MNDAPALVRPRALQFRVGRRAAFMTADAALLGAAYVLAYLVRFEGEIPAVEVGVMWRSLPLIVGTIIAVLELFGLYRRVWRYAGLADITRIMSALTTGTLTGGMLLFLLGMRGQSRMVLVTFYAVAAVLVAGFRVGARNLARLPVNRRSSGVPTLIIGAGDTADMVIREMQKNRALPYRPIGVVTDEEGALGMQIRGVPVVGVVDDLPLLIADLSVKEVVAADPDLSGAECKRIVNLCLPAGLTVRVFPSAEAVLDGRIEISRVRTVQLEDLLRRRPVPPDLQGMSAYLGGKRVLVTGAGGSIGSELCRQTCRTNPAQLIMVDRVENSLYEIDLEISERFPDVVRSAQLADIRTVPRMQEIFERFRPDIVFHAAAFKHVPLMEAHPSEVVLNNIVGTWKLARIALHAGVADFVLISSDKAVNPANVMGVSKRATELIMQFLSHGPARGRTKFSAVRFGNVLGSAGSLIPRLRRQIALGGPVTITHPQMTRYFMTISEAVQLVIEAAAMSGGGDIFLLDMGEPVNVVDLARDLISLSGLQPGRDIAITFTGLRPGEKLTEELWSTTEEPTPTRRAKISALREHQARPPLNLNDVVNELEVLAEQGRIAPMLQLLQRWMPEFAPQIIATPDALRGSAQRFRVVIADDDAEMCSLISLALRRAEIEAITAADGLEALEKIATLAPHLVILDLKMPKLDGLTLFEKLKAGPATRHLPIMLITGYSELGEGAKGMEFNADDFISKPFRLPELVLRVEAILHRRYRGEDAPSPKRREAHGKRGPVGRVAARSGAGAEAVEPAALQSSG